MTGVRRVELTGRDLEIMMSLADLRFLTVDQLGALHFPSRASADLRLRKLRRAGFLGALPMGIRGGGTMRLIYGLARRGAEVLRPRFNGELTLHMKPSARRSTAFVEHLLLRNELRVVLELLDRDSQLQLLNFQHRPEQLSVAAFMPRKQEKQLAIADAFVAVLVEGQCFTFLVEIDRATVSLPRMRQRYAIYETWWRGGGAAARFGDVPMRVLTLTTTAHHERLLSRVAPNSPLLWFTTFDALRITEPKRLLEVQWTLATGERSTLFH